MQQIITNEQTAQRIMRLMIAAVPAHEIASTLNVPLPTVTLITKSPMFQALLAKERIALKQRLASSAAEKIEALQDVAVQKLEERLYDDEDKGIQMRAIENTLDRGGNPRKTQHDSTMRVVLQIDKKEREAIEVACTEAGLSLPAPPPPTIPGVSHINDLLDELPDDQ